MASSDNAPLDLNWVTLPDFAKSQNVTYRTALKWITTGQLEAVMVGGRWRVYEAGMRKFLQGIKTTASVQKEKRG